MKKQLTSLAIAGLLAGASNLTAASLLSNGNLDRTHAVEVVSGFFLPQPDVWVNAGSRTLSGPYLDDLSSEAWAGPAPTPLTTDGLLNGPFPAGYDGPDGGVFFKPFTGNLATGDLATVRLFQDRPAAAGLMYLFSGWAGAEANYSGLISGTQTRSLFYVSFLDGANNIIGGAE